MSIIEFHDKLDDKKSNHYLQSRVYDYEEMSNGTEMM